MNENMWRWAHEADNWLGMVLFSFLLGALFSWSIFLCYDPHRKERAVAKRAKAKHIAGIVEAALSTHVRQELLTQADKEHYLKVILKALNIRNIQERSPSRLVFLPTGKIWPIPLTDLAHTKAKVKKRLTAMGVNIAEALKSLRKKEKVDKKKQLLTALKKSHHAS